MKAIIIKNLLVHAALIPFYLFASREIANISQENLDTLVLFVGLIVIAPITSNFIYSYGAAKTKKALCWGHITTGFSMLVIGMLFVALDILLLQMIGNVLTFRLSILFFWLAVITFDFADFYLRDSNG